MCFFRKKTKRILSNVSGDEIQARLDNFQGDKSAPVDNGCCNRKGAIIYGHDGKIIKGANGEVVSFEKYAEEDTDGLDEIINIYGNIESYIADSKKRNHDMSYTFDLLEREGVDVGTYREEHIKSTEKKNIKSTKKRQDADKLLDGMRILSKKVSSVKETMGSIDDRLAKLLEKEKQKVTYQPLSRSEIKAIASNVTNELMDAFRQNQLDRTRPKQLAGVGNIYDVEIIER